MLRVSVRRWSPQDMFSPSFPAGKFGTTVGSKLKLALRITARYVVLFSPEVSLRSVDNGFLKTREVRSFRKVPVFIASWTVGQSWDFGWRKHLLQLYLKSMVIGIGVSIFTYVLLLAVIMFCTLFIIILITYVNSP